MTLREELKSEAITVNGDEYVLLEQVEEILNEIENTLLPIPDLMKRLY